MGLTFEYPAEVVYERAAANRAMREKLDRLVGGIETLKADRDEWDDKAAEAAFPILAHYADGVRDGLELAIATLEDLIEGNPEEGQAAPG